MQQKANPFIEIFTWEWGDEIVGLLNRSIKKCIKKTGDFQMFSITPLPGDTSNYVTVCEKSISRKQARAHWKKDMGLDEFKD